MHRTINNLTQVSKIQKDTKEEHEVISQTLIFEEVTANLAEVIQQSGTVIYTDFAAHPEVWFTCKNLKSVLYNLVSNAIKYRSPDRLPVVSVTSAAMDHYAVVSVTDNGRGMDLASTRKKYFRCLSACATMWKAAA